MLAPVLGGPHRPSEVVAEEGRGAQEVLTARYGGYNSRSSRSILGELRPTRLWVAPPSILCSERGLSVLWLRAFEDSSD